MNQVMDYRPGHFPVGVLPILRRAALQIGNQPRHIHHHIAIEQAGRQFGIADMGRAGILIGPLQIIHHGKVVAFALLPVHGKGVGDMDGGFNVSPRVGSNHPPKERALQTAGQGCGFAESLKVAGFAAPSDKKLGGRFPSGFSVRAVFLGNSGGLAFQVLHFRQAQQQGLAAAFTAVLAAIDAVIQRAADGVQHSGIVAALFFQRVDYRPVNDIAGAVRLRSPGDVMDGKVILRLPPVPLEALGRDARAGGVPERHPLGKAAVVPVQQRRRVGMERMDLQETGNGHSVNLLDGFAYSSVAGELRRCA